MDRTEQKRRWFWVTLALSSISIVAFVFGLWELVEKHFFRDTDYLTLHYLYISRGMVTSLLLVFWAAWFVLRDRRTSEAELHRSRERYRGLLEASPGAVALYDDQLIVSEWNAAAEMLYGFSKEEVLGHFLPTLDPEQEQEVNDLVRRVSNGQPVVDMEIRRRNKEGTVLDVQLNLLPFSEPSGQKYFLEITADIRERVRLRQSLLELEKLTTMGQMAAGTAHHLNTPLASMLLRLQMMRNGCVDNIVAADLERLETSARFCQQFVQRLLDFSRRPQLQKQPEPVRAAIESVVSFLSPQMLAKRARLTADLAAADGHKVLADRNQLEALFLILLSNSLDAIGDDGTITVRCYPNTNGHIEIQIADDGCGIKEQHLAHIFEPFFTTKPPGKGTGLGLAIAGNILRDHGGSVRLKSAPGAGTTAYIDLPLTACVPEEAPRT